MPLRLVSFDLDGTLIRPAIFNAVADALGFGDKLEETTRLYFEGKMSADETFHADHKHFVGRSVEEMREALRASAYWTPGIREAVVRLHASGIRVAVTTDQPSYLVEITRELFGVDDLVCTEAEVVQGRVTGRYELAHDKWSNLKGHLDRLAIDPRDVAHIGNGSNDVPVFTRVGVAIAVDPMNDAVRRAAQVSIEPLLDARQVVDRLADRRQL